MVNYKHVSFNAACIAAVLTNFALFGFVVSDRFTVRNGRGC